MHMTLGDLIDRGVASLQTGPFGSQLHKSDYVSQGVPIVPTEAIGWRKLDTSVMPSIGEETATRLARHRIRAGDILFARRGIQATGLSALVEPQHDGFICGTGAIRLRLHASSGVDPIYLSFILIMNETREWLRAHAVGAVMPNLNEGVLRGVPLRIPSIAEQKTIAEALCTLDDKIEQNRRTGRALEGLARATFKAWFVDFEPVKAKAAGQTSFPGMPPATFATLPDRLTNSRLGPVPLGWEVRALADAFDVNPPRRLSKGQDAPYLDMKNMPTDGHAPDRWERRPHGSGMRFINGDTLVARITPCLENGKTAYVDFLNGDDVAWGSTEYIVLRPKPPLPEIFAYCLARTPEFRDFAIQNMTGTSGRQRVAASALQHYHAAIPDALAAAAFGKIASPLFDFIRAGKTESSKLAALRDYLLPRLLSGRVRVKDAEREVAHAS